MKWDIPDVVPGRSEFFGARHLAPILNHTLRWQVSLFVLRTHLSGITLFEATFRQIIGAIAPSGGVNVER
jgi:hypothetical protein